MDTVPFKFVDAVVELFGERTLKPLAEFDDNTIWKDVIDLHFRNRRYGTLYIGGVKDGFKVTVTPEGEHSSYTIQELQEHVDRRFARFVQVISSSDITITDSLELRKEDHKKLKWALSQQFTNGSEWVIALGTQVGIEKWIVEGLFPRVYVSVLNLNYSGTIYFDFLKDQIENNPILHYINLHGEWPDAIQSYLRKYLLQTGARRSLIYGRLRLANDFMEEVLKLWRENDEFKCTFRCFVSPDEESMPYLRAMQRDPTSRTPTYRLKHDTRKSVVSCSIDFHKVFEIHNCESGCSC